MSPDHRCGLQQEKSKPMALNAGDYITRADECSRLCNLTKDEMIQAVLQRQRQIYLKMAAPG